MPIATVFLVMMLCVAGSPHAAMAQGAATGGTRDSGSPTMVFPIRPRDEPSTPTAVPNRSRHSHPAIRLRRSYYYRIHRR
jgi:hypothetical protein